SYIGIRPDGVTAAGNGRAGIEFLGVDNNTVGGTAASARNVVSGNGDAGILLASNGNTIQGNFIGTNAAGTVAISNGATFSSPPTGDGIFIQSNRTGNLIGGTLPGAGNLVVANTSNGAGIHLNGAKSTIIQGNYIGTDVTGSIALGVSSWSGIYLDN